MFRKKGCPPPDTIQHKATGPQPTSSLHQVSGRAYTMVRLPERRSCQNTSACTDLFTRRVFRTLSHIHTTKAWPVILHPHVLPAYPAASHRQQPSHTELYMADSASTRIQLCHQQHSSWWPTL